MPVLRNERRSLQSCDSSLLVRFGNRRLVPCCIFLLPAPGSQVMCSPCYVGLVAGTPLPIRARPGHRLAVNNSLAQRHVDSEWSRNNSVGAAQLLGLLQAKRTAAGAMTDYDPPAVCCTSSVPRNASYAHGAELLPATCSPATWPWRRVFGWHRPGRPQLAYTQSCAANAECRCRPVRQVGSATRAYADFFAERTCIVEMVADAAAQVAGWCQTTSCSWCMVGLAWSMWASRLATTPQHRWRSTPCSVNLRRRATRWLGSRAATHSSSVGAAKRCSTLKREASPSTPSQVPDLLLPCVRHACLLCLKRCCTRVFLHQTSPCTGFHHMQMCWHRDYSGSGHLCRAGHSYDPQGRGDQRPLPYRPCSPFWRGRPRRSRHCSCRSTHDAHRVHGTEDAADPHGQTLGCVAACCHWRCVAS